MHEVGIVGNGHLALAYCPGAVFAQYLSVVVACIGRPVLGIDKIGSFKSFHLVIFYAGISYELGVEFITFGMCNHKVIISCIHPFGKGVGDSLGQWTRMWSPCHHYFGACRLLIFLNGYQVGKTLQRMACGSLHGEYRPAGMLDELLQYHFVVIVFLIFEACKRTYADDVAIAAHHGNGFQ